MGWFSNLFSSAARRAPGRQRAVQQAQTGTTRRCAIEPMEARCMLTANPIWLGTVYVEQDDGHDTTGDHFEITFSGGAPGTELTRLIVDGDQNEPGRGVGDVFFDTKPGEFGADLHFPFTIVQLVSGNPHARVEAHVVDGSTRLVLDFHGFQGGDRLTFLIDVDEVEEWDPNETDWKRINEGVDPITSGVEFQGSQLIAHFSAPHYKDAESATTFRNVYDPLLQSSGLDLPEDDWNGLRARTAAGFVNLQQEVNPASISGYVYADANHNGVRETGERGLAGVPIHVIPVTPIVPQQTVTVVTDASGFYEAVGLAPGTYRIVQPQQPASYLDGLDAAGTVEGVPSGQAVNPGDNIEDIFLGGGSRGIEYNFGEVLPASLEGTVRLTDADGNCHATGGVTTPLAGVLVQLLDRRGRIVTQTRTNASGHYAFTWLEPGLYSVIEVTPEGLIDAGARAGRVEQTVRGRVFDPNTIVEIELRPGDQGLEYDFCEHLPAVLSGFVYHDRNDNAMRDPGEEAIAGVRLTIFDQHGNQVAVGHTDQQGAYEFRGLRAGTYRIVEGQPEGWLDGHDSVGRVDGKASGRVGAGDTLSDVVLRWGSAGVDYNFGELLPGTLQGQVHADRNGNGTLDPGEHTIAGVVIQLVDQRGSIVATAWTDSDGQYRFVDIIPGQYVVRETQPEGYLQGGQRAGSHGGDDALEDLISRIHVGSGQQLVDYDFWEIEPTRISGIVYVDPNQNRRFDPGERLLAGVAVHLLNAEGRVVATVTTNERGYYEFTQLRPGTYGLHEVQPEGYFHGGQQAGSHGGNASVADYITSVVAGPGQMLVDYDFHESPPASISGYVFVDGPPLRTVDGLPPENWTDLRDGQRTPTSRPIAGVVLELRHGLNGEPVMADQALAGVYAGGPIRVVTDAQGHYVFHGLPRGNYAVYQIHPEAYVDGLDTPGTTSGIAFNGDTEFLRGLIERLAEDPAGDAIVQIPLGAGVHSRENNFSEILVERIVVPPVPPPPTPPVWQPTVLVVPPAVPWPFGPFGLPPVIPSIPVYGASGEQTLAWHLSVVDGGMPRGDTPDIDLNQGRWRTVSYLQHTQWISVALNRGYWSLPSSVASMAVEEGEELSFGIPGGIPLSGDWNGDGVSQLGVFKDGHWFLDLNGNGRWDEEDLWAKLGGEGDLPVVGDWNGDGKDDIGIFGPKWEGDERAIEAEPGLPTAQNVFRRRLTPTHSIPKNLPPEPDEATDGHRVLKRTAHGDPRVDVIDHVFRFGVDGDLPVVGDWNGDGIRTIGIFRGGSWYLDVDGDGRFTERDAKADFGQPGDRPVAGDWNGDGIDQIGVFRQGTWYLDTNGNRELDANDEIFRLGEAGDQPVAGDWNGDGIDQPAVYRDAG